MSERDSQHRRPSPLSREGEWVRWERAGRERRPGGVRGPQRACSLLLLACAFLAPASPAQEPAPPQLDQIFEQFFERYLELHPTFASSIGDHRYDDRLTLDLLPAHRRQRAALYEGTRSALSEVRREQLSDTDRLHSDALDYALELYLEALRFDDHLMPIAPGVTLQARFPQLGSGRGDHPFETTGDYRAFLSRIEDFSTWVDAAIANLRRGVEVGVVEPRSLIEDTLPELEAQFRVKVEKSPFWKPVAEMPEAIPAANRKRLKAAYRQAIGERLMPAYRRLHDYLRQEYLSAARDTISLSAVPGGKDAYRHLVRFYTTTEMTPDEVFELGLEEVERIEGEMEELKRRSGFRGSLQSFRQRLGSDARSYLEGRKAVLDGFAEIRERVAPALDRLFHLRPATDFEIRQVEAYRAATAPGAFYERSSAGRPGTFYFNLRGRYYPRFTMEVLFLHEAVPGHHFQIALASEQENLPRFLRHGYFGAFTEGWGLYCEGLGRSLDLYTDALQYYGRLVYDLGRASRLVADVGIHHKGWTRAEALRYLGERHLDWAMGEIDRYVGMPGQALGYKVGEREIWRLRRRAETVLGEKFDVRRFHDEVLKDGALPLAILSRKIDRWIAGERTGGGSGSPTPAAR